MSLTYQLRSKEWLANVRRNEAQTRVESSEILSLSGFHLTDKIWQSANQHQVEICTERLSGVPIRNRRRGRALVFPVRFIPQRYAPVKFGIQIQLVSSFRYWRTACIKWECCRFDGAPLCNHSIDLLWWRQKTLLVSRRDCKQLHDVIYDFVDCSINEACDVTQKYVLWSNERECTLGLIKKYVTGLGGGSSKIVTKCDKGGGRSSQRVMSPLQKNIVSIIALKWL